MNDGGWKKDDKDDDVNAPFEYGSADRFIRRFCLFAPLVQSGFLIRSKQKTAIFPASITCTHILLKFASECLCASTLLRSRITICIYTHVNVYTSAHKRTLTHWSRSIGNVRGSEGAKSVTKQHSRWATAAVPIHPYTVPQGLLQLLT